MPAAAPAQDAAPGRGHGGGAQRDVRARSWTGNETPCGRYGAVIQLGHDRLEFLLVLYQGFGPIHSNVGPD